MNIFNFYNMVYSKLEALDQSKFLLGEDMVRIDPSLKPALREALVNTLAHADYTIPRGSVKILAYDDRYVFQNPGCMLIRPEDFFVGGQSEIRNEIIMKCFRMLHLSERQGMGGSGIFKITCDNKVRAPRIDTNLMATELTIWKVDITDYPNLSAREKAILSYMVKVDRAVTTNELLEHLAQFKRDAIRRSLNSLVEMRLVNKTGASVSTAYEINLKPAEPSASPAIQTFLNLFRQE